MIFVGYSYGGLVIKQVRKPILALPISRMIVRLNC